MRQPLIGVYIPPEDETTIGHLEKAIERFNQGQTPIILGDLNVNLRYPWGPRGQRIADLLATAGVSSMLHHFRQRESYRDHATWRQFSATGKDIINRGWNDYILAPERRRMQCVVLRDPAHFSTDHLMVMGKLTSKTFRANRRYLRRRTRFPLQAPQVGPTSPFPDRQFQKLKEASEQARGETRSRPHWISEATWALVDRRSALRLSHGYTQAERIPSGFPAIVSACLQCLQWL